LKEERFDHIPKLGADQFANSGTLPDSVDLRSGMPPIYDQGQLGSCSANALCAVYSFHDPSVMGSRLFLYYNERKMENSIDDDSGACLSDGVEAMHTYGLCDEKNWPYSDEGDQFKQQPHEGCYQEAVTHEASAYHHVEQTEEAMKACLASGYPFVTGIKIFESFYSVGADGKYDMPDQSKDTCLGGHAIVIVGYKNDRGWIMRNSWGADWGEGGHCYLPFPYLLTDDLCHGDAWVISSVSKAPIQAPPTKIKPHRPHAHHSAHHFKHDT